MVEWYSLSWSCRVVYIQTGVGTGKVQVCLFWWVAMPPGRFLVIDITC